MKIKLLIIHLEKSIQRKNNAESLTELVPDAEIIPAVDGSQLRVAEIDAVYQPHLHFPSYPFTLSSGEIGCFLSHRRAWQAIVDENLEVGLIAEDDIKVDPEHFSRVLQSACAQIQPGDYLRFPRRDRSRSGTPIHSNEECLIVREHYVGLGAQLQLVTREAAKALLLHTRQFDRPIDTFLQLRSVPEIRVAAFYPIIVNHADTDLGGTTIHSRPRGLGATLSRELKRFAYRSTLRTLQTFRRR